MAAGGTDVTNDPFLTHSKMEERPTPIFGSTRRMRQKLARSPAVTEVALIPSAALFLSCLGFCLGYYFVAPLPWLVVAVCLCQVAAVQSQADSRSASAGGASLDSYYDTKNGLAQTAPARQASRAPLYMGSLGVVIGTVVGLWLYENSMATFWTVTVGAWYSNAIASNPAATYSDAGAIRFSSSSRVDSTKAVGYMYGTTYCAAPVLSTLPDQVRVNFWAVGTDCCGPRGTFWCDDASDAVADSAVPDPPYGWLSRHERAGYELAIREAEALYDISSDPQRMILRWVESPVKLRAALGVYSLIVLLVTTVVFLLFGIAVVLALTLQQASSDSSETGASSV